MIVNINDFTPWDDIVQWGNAFHGHWQKVGSTYQAVSGLTGNVITLNSTEMAWTVGSGPCWLTQFSGLPMPETNTAEAAAGMYWTNWAVWSGQDRVYDSIRISGLDFQIYRSQFEWPYRCTDGSVYWMRYDSTSKVFRASKLDIFNDRFGHSWSEYPIVFDLNPYPTAQMTWLNFSPTGAKAAIGFSNVGAEQPLGILELSVTGGSSTVTPVISLTRYRQTYELIITDFPSELVFTEISATEPLIDSFGLSIMDVDGVTAIKTLPTSDDPNKKWLWNGLAHKRSRNVIFVDYDGESSIDVGEATEIKCTYEQLIVPGPPYNGNPTSIITASTETTHIAELFRGNESAVFWSQKKVCPHPTNLVIPSDPDEYAAAMAENLAQVYFQNIINLGPPVNWSYEGSIEPRRATKFVSLWGKYLILSKDEVPYWNDWNNKRYYSYNTQTNIYSWACSKSSGIIEDSYLCRFDEFSINPLNGNLIKGVVGYF